MLRLQPGHYFGKPTRTRMFGEFRIVATRYEPDTSLPTHCHEQAYLLVSLRGTSIESALHRDHVCSRGSVVFNQAGESHRDQISREGAEALNVELPLSWLDRVVPRMRANPVLYRHVGVLSTRSVRCRSPCPRTTRSRLSRSRRRSPRFSTHSSRPMSPIPTAPVG